MRRRLLVTILSLIVLVLLGLSLPLGFILGYSAQQTAFTRSQGDTVRFASLAQPLLDPTRSDPARKVERDTLEAKLDSQETARGVGVAVVDATGQKILAASQGLCTAETLSEVLAPEQADEAREQVANALTGKVSEPAVARRWDTAPLVVAEAVRVGGQPRGAVLTVSPPMGLGQRVLWWWSVLAGAAAAVLAVAVLLVLPVVRWILRPVAELNAATGRVAAAIAAGRPAERVRSGSGPNELRRLTHSFDRMAATVSDAMTAQRAFVADASHQLRNPLTALRLRLQLLDECLQGPSAEHYLAAVEETERLRSMLDDLLALARTEASTAAPASRVRLEDVVADRLQAWRAAADAQNLDLHHTPSGLAVLMAPATIATALDAVLDNALKFTPGPGVVAVTARRTRDGQVELAVQDTGPGLTDDELARAPDRFWRSPRHQNVPGSGLGLAIVQRSLRAAGGDTRLERPGQGGLRVVLTLPAAPDEPPAPSPWSDHRLVDQSLLPDHSSSDSR